jgi:hypothetical protein
MYVRHVILTMKPILYRNMFFLLFSILTKFYLFINKNAIKLKYSVIIKKDIVILLIVNGNIKFSSYYLINI